MWVFRGPQVAFASCVILAILTDTGFAQHTQPKSGLQVTVECRPVYIRASRFKSLNLPLTPSLPASTTVPEFPDGTEVGSHQTVTKTQRPVGTTILNVQQAFELLKAQQADERISGTFLPQATVRDGGKATINDTSPRRFVVGFRKSSKGLEPRVRTINEGQLIHIHATILGRNRVRLRYTVQTIEIPSVKTATWPGTDRRVQVPVVRSESFSGSAILETRADDIDSLALVPVKLDPAEQPRRKSLFAVRRKQPEKIQQLFLLLARVSDPDEEADLILSDLVD